jgi:protoheme IX farnesyltransferase
VPMLPVVARAEVVARQVVVYSWVMVATSLALWPVAGTGLLYPVVAGVLGAVFLAQAHAMWRRARGTEDLSAIRPMVLFHASNLYLSLLFVAVAIEPLVH